MCVDQIVLRVSAWEANNLLLGYWPLYIYTLYFVLVLTCAEMNMPGLTITFHNFLRPTTLNFMTFQAWKMKFLNSMTFQVFNDLYEP